MLLQMFLYDTLILHVSLHFVIFNIPRMINEVDIVHFYNISDIYCKCSNRPTTLDNNYDIDIGYNI